MAGKPDKVRPNVELFRVRALHSCRPSACRSPPGRGVMRTRNWPIRAKIISLLMIPLVALIVMWLLATAVTLGPGLDLLATRNTVATIARPAQNLATEVQAERKL